MNEGNREAADFAEQQELLKKVMGALTTLPQSELHQIVSPAVHEGMLSHLGVINIQRALNEKGMKVSFEEIEALDVLIVKKIKESDELRSA